MRICLLTGPVLLAYAGLSACAGGAAPTTCDGSDVGAEDTRPPAVAVEEDPPEPFESAAAPFFTTYCYACHRGERQEGDTDLSILTAANFAEQAELWEEVGFHVESRAMPTGWGSLKPSDEERTAFVAWVNAQLEATPDAE